MGIKNIYGRFIWFDSRVREKKYPNTTALANPFEISTKTAPRDIDFMRDRLNCPLNTIEGGWAIAMKGKLICARTGKTKKEIRGFIEKSFGYNLSMTLDEIRPIYGFDESCQGTVPQAITAFLESEDFEDAVRNAISLGGDSDTLACITGGIAQAFYGGVPGFITQKVIEILDKDLRRITCEFMEVYCKI